MEEEVPHQGETEEDQAVEEENIPERDDLVEIVDLAQDPEAEGEAERIESIVTEAVDQEIDITETDPGLPEEDD